MEVYSFAVRCSPDERKIYISSDQESEYKVTKTITPEMVMDKIHQLREEKNLL